ncbi:MAG: ATP-binding cassette domain-containing protein, partial [Candidatus Kariarchaeaceae archaeon]
FSVEILPGELFPGDIIGIIGPNGIGKSTFAKLVAGVLQPTEIDEEVELKRKRITEENEEEEDDSLGANEEGLELTLSYKPQYLESDSEETVEKVLQSANYKVLTSSFYNTELIIPLGIEKLLSHRLSTLSGGELQRVGIAVCLAKDADLYLIDEPSAFISAEDRLMVAKTIRRMVMHRRSAAFVIEHDLMLQSYISDRIIHFTGEPGVRGSASEPLSVRDGMNAFLKLQGVTFRRDHNTGRPRVNKLDSKLDKQQKASGDYYLS